MKVNKHKNPLKTGHSSGSPDFDTFGETSRTGGFPLDLFTDKKAVMENEMMQIQQHRSRIIRRIEEKTGLAFIPEKETKGRVCFINHPDVRDDFRISFTLQDVFDYGYAVVHSTNRRECHPNVLNKEVSEVPYPENANSFWNFVATGKELRKCDFPEST